MSVIALAAGGTAGHIEPAIACAKAIKELDSNTEVFIVGTSKGLERNIVPQRGIELALIPATPLPRSLSFETLSLPFRLWAAKRIAQQLLVDRKVDCVVGFGAYVSLPMYLAAKKLNISVIIHEGNKKAGLANRIGSKFAKDIFQMFPNSIKGAKTIGMPLRSEISNLNKESSRIGARVSFGLDPNKSTLLVFGGSQGASSINKAIVESLQELESLNIQILHAIGSKNSVVESTKKFEFYHPVSYIDKMELAYAAADLVISRAGAMTIAEQTVLAMPAIYVPFASGNGEQSQNVAELVKDGGGVVISDAELSPTVLVRQVKELLANPAKLHEISQAASRHSLRDADKKVAQSALALASAHK
jgi:UDP-N-acetylglucosamine--N-acetylmuramyl-(pentapeptide) pyrophosphoryl-undecaprenol N-acetylglucosamine transferase